MGAEVSAPELGTRLAPQLVLSRQHIPEPVRLPLLCTSQIGYQNLCQLITRFKMRERGKAEGAATIKDLAEFSGGLICLTGGDEGPLAAALHRGGEMEAQRSVQTLIHHVTLVLPDRVIENGWLLVEDGRILDLGAEATRPAPGAHAIDGGASLGRDRDGGDGTDRESAGGRRLRNNQTPTSRSGRSSATSNSYGSRPLLSRDGSDSDHSVPVIRDFDQLDVINDHEP